MFGHIDSSWFLVLFPEMCVQLIEREVTLESIRLVLVVYKPFILPALTARFAPGNGYFQPYASASSVTARTETKLPNLYLLSGSILKFFRNSNISCYWWELYLLTYTSNYLPIGASAKWSESTLMGMGWQFFSVGFQACSIWGSRVTTESYQQ
jgi:hypothetical protein